MNSFTVDRWQSKTLLTIDKRGSKYLETVFFFWRLSPAKMAIENSVLNDLWSTFVNSINFFDWSLSGVSFIVVLSLDFLNLSAVIECKKNA